jgi:hypothetical protein
VRDYLIEVPHSPEECPVSTARGASPGESVHTFRGCGGGTHTTWIVAELASEEEAWRLVPALLRDTARVVPVEASKEVSQC